MFLSVLEEPILDTNILNLPTQTKDSDRIHFPFNDLDRQRQPTKEYPHNLYSVLEDYGVFPSFSLILGLCTDGLPFMLSLDNPRSGSILIVGDRRRDKTQMLKVICHSASLLNDPDEVSYFIISNKTNEYVDLLSYPHCQEIISPYDRSAGELVIELASIAEQRRTGRERGSKMMLLIDDLSSLAHLVNDYSVYLNLRSMINRGPRSGIWPIVSISNQGVHDMKSQLVRTYGTYIFDKYTSGSQELIDPGNQESQFDVIIKGRLISIDNLVI